jgi:hypothetical protein
VIFRHAGTLEEVDGILTLSLEQTVTVVCHGDAKEVVKINEVRHGELRVETQGDMLKLGQGQRREDDVINI